MDKKIIASHKSYVGQQLFIIYEDETYTMFPVLSQKDKPDEFYPSEAEFYNVMEEIFQKAKK